jgi:Flp pilus assembly protein TadG
MKPRYALPLLRSVLHDVRRDVRGVSAIEFAFIAPILIVLYMGMAEVTSALMAARKASHAVSAVGDLVAQQQAMTTSTMANIFQGADDIMTPFPTTGLLPMRAFSVSVRSDNSVQVDWACVPAGQSDPSLTLLSLNQIVISSSGALTAVKGLSSSQEQSIQSVLADPTTGQPSQGASVIVAQGNYTFNSLVGSFSNVIASFQSPVPMTFSNTYYFKPRQTSVVGWSGATSGQCNG